MTQAGQAAFTVGHGGRAPADFTKLLTSSGVKTLVDVRLRPDRASMGRVREGEGAGRGDRRAAGECRDRLRVAPGTGQPLPRHDDWPARYERFLNGFEERVGGHRVRRAECRREGFEPVAERRESRRPLPYLREVQPHEFANAGSEWPCRAYTFSPTARISARPLPCGTTPGRMV